MNDSKNEVEHQSHDSHCQNIQISTAYSAMTSTSPAGSIHHAAPLTEGSHQFMTRIINGINGHARSHTLITFPIKVPRAGFRPLVNGLRKRNSAMTIGKSISITSIDCFQAV